MLGIAPSCDARALATGVTASCLYPQGRRIMRLQDWLDRNRAQLGSGYELLFVEGVLARVPEIDPLTLHS